MKSEIIFSGIFGFVHGYVVWILLFNHVTEISAKIVDYKGSKNELCNVFSTTIVYVFLLLLSLTILKLFGEMILKEVTKEMFKYLILGSALGLITVGVMKKHFFIHENKDKSEK